MDYGLIHYISILGFRPIELQFFISCFFVIHHSIPSVFFGVNLPSPRHISLKLWVTTLAFPASLHTPWHHWVWPCSSSVSWSNRWADWPEMRRFRGVYGTTDAWQLRRLIHIYLYSLRTHLFCDAPRGGARSLD